MVSVCFVVLFLLASGAGAEELSLGRRLQAGFNKFKSYANVPAPNRPPAYSATQNAHDINEYLTPQQQFMKSQRNSPISSANAITGAWSGFNEYKTLGFAPAPSSGGSSNPSLRGSLKTAPLSSRAGGISS